MLYPKARIVRSPNYRRYVSGFACFGCGVEGFSQCAHGNTGKGMAMKVCDTRTFPLCGPHWGMPGCHYLFDNCIDMSRDERRELEERYIERMQFIAKADGRPEFAEKESA
jgi:hypothetical protein